MSLAVYFSQLQEIKYLDGLQVLRVASDLLQP